MEKEQTKLQQAIHDHYKDLYLDALNNAPTLLAENPKEKRLLPRLLQVSESRGHQPVLTREARDIENTSITVIANTGALDYNSPAYVRPELDARMAEIMEVDKIAYATRMLAYTKEGDLFVLESPDPEKSKRVLNIIADSYAKIGITTTRDFLVVPSVEDYVLEKKGTEPMMFAAALDPILVASFGKTEKEKEELLKEALINAAWYTKDGAEQTWRAHGVAVPDTSYMDLGKQSALQVSQQIREIHPGHDAYVISTFDGAGGDGIKFVGADELETVLGEFFAGKQIMVQGKLPLEDSPCTIANITDVDVDVLLVTRQRVKNGAHAGNQWIRGRDTVSAVVRHALDVLKNRGARGQVNLDSLHIDVGKLNGLLPSLRRIMRDNILMREVNVRPAGSSVIIRQEKGNINRKRIDTINTQAAIEIPYKVFISDRFQRLVNNHGHENMAIVQYNYDILHDKVALAFLGATGIASEELSSFEESMTEQIKRVVD